MSTRRSHSPETRVALIGAGYVSTHHIRALQALPHIRIVGIADTSVDRAKALAARFNIPGVYESLADMRAAADARPDVVHILTPPDSHARLAIEALEMGCDVFVEKPMAPTVAECDAMIAAANRTGRTLSVNHSAKDDPVIVRALDMLRSGAIGDVLAVDFYRTSDYPPYAGGPLPASFRRGGYPFEDLGIHALYLIEAFLGRIADVNVRYRSTGRDPHVYFDEWRGDVACAKGVGSFYLSWSARPIRNELFVHGTRGDLHIDCFLQTCTVRRTLPGPKPISAGVNAMTQAAGALWHVPKNVWRLATGSLRPSPGIHAGVLRFHEALAQGIEPGRAEPEPPRPACGERDATPTRTVRASGAPAGVRGQCLEPPVTMEEGRRMVAWLEPACREADARRDLDLRLAEPLEPRRILVTGASGLLGRALVERLRVSGQGDEVRVLVRRPSPQLEALPNVQVVYGDLGDPEAVDRAVAGVRLVYHAGATMRGRWAEFEAGTVRGTANVVESCLKHGVERLVHVSSLSVLDYAARAERAVVDENAPLEPFPEKRGSYTRAKLMAERIVVDACRQRGLQAVVVRPGQIVGPGYETASPYGTIALAGRWIAIGSGRLKLPLVHVNDVVSGLMAAAARPDVCGAIFHLVDSAPVTQREYIARCRDRIRVSYVPRTALLAAGTALDVVGAVIKRNLPLTSYRIRSIRELTFDCSAARRRLGWGA